jgi:hypothetical protein
MRPAVANYLGPADQLRGDDAQDTALLKGMYHEARAYIESFRWCRRIRDAWFGFGVGGIVGLFLFNVEGDPEVDEWLWVVVGDLPSAYFVLDCSPSPRAALEVYCDLMSNWVRAVQAGTPLDEVFPVSAPADLDHAAMLESRLRFLRNSILPLITEPRHKE